MGAPADSIPRGNVEEFVAYGFHCRLLGQLDGKERARISRFVDDVRGREAEGSGIAWSRGARLAQGVCLSFGSALGLPLLSAGHPGHRVLFCGSLRPAARSFPLLAAFEDSALTWLGRAIRRAPSTSRLRRPGAFASSRDSTRSCPSWLMCGSR